MLWINWPYFGHFEFHIQFWPSGWIMSCVIWSQLQITKIAIPNFGIKLRCKKQEESTKASLVLQLSHRHNQLYLTIKLIYWCLDFEHLVQSHHNTCRFGLHFYYKCCHMYVYHSNVRCSRETTYDPLITLSIYLTYGATQS